MMQREAKGASMLRVTATELQKSFGRISDQAVKEPVTITKQGRDHLVLMSAEEYARLKRRDRKVYTADTLPDEWVKALEEARMPPGFEHLDAELGDEVEPAVSKP
jgi:prevent-host-death family protein